jgi:hypothetical protein
LNDKEFMMSFTLLNAKPQTSNRHFLISVMFFCFACFPFEIQADSPITPPANPPRQQRPLPTRILYWVGAGIAMLLVARKVFQEQLHERIVIRKLSDQIGPFYREFDPINLHRWVDRAAPYFFDALHKKDISGLEAFAQPAFINHWKDYFSKNTQPTEILELSKILKVHPIGVYPTIENTAPLGVEVVLRVEIKIFVHQAQAQAQAQAQLPIEKQIQDLWTLKHDGHHWQIQEIREIFDDVIGLNTKPDLPALLDWAPPNQYRKETIDQIDALDQQQIS